MKNNGNENKTKVNWVTKSANAKIFGNIELTTDFKSLNRFIDSFIKIKLILQKEKKFIYILELYY